MVENLTISQLSPTDPPQGGGTGVGLLSPSPLVGEGSGLGGMRSRDASIQRRARAWNECSLSSSGTCSAWLSQFMSSAMLARQSCLRSRASTTRANALGERKSLQVLPPERQVRGRLAAFVPAGQGRRDVSALAAASPPGRAAPRSPRCWRTDPTTPPAAPGLPAPDDQSSLPGRGRLAQNVA